MRNSFDRWWNLNPEGITCDLVLPRLLYQVLTESCLSGSCVGRKWSWDWSWQVTCSARELTPPVYILTYCYQRHLGRKAYKDVRNEAKQLWKKGEWTDGQNKNSVRREAGNRVHARGVIMRLQFLYKQTKKKQPEMSKDKDFQNKSIPDQSLWPIS